MLDGYRYQTGQSLFPIRIAHAPSRLTWDVMLQCVCGIGVVEEENQRVSARMIASGCRYHSVFQVSPNWRLLKSKRVKQNQTIHQCGRTSINSISTRPDEF